MSPGRDATCIAVARLAELTVRLTPDGAVRLEVGHDPHHLRTVHVAPGDHLEVEFGSGLSALIGFGRVRARLRRGSDVEVIVDHSVDVTLDGEFDDRLATELELALQTAGA